MYYDPHYCSIIALDSTPVDPPPQGQGDVADVADYFAVKGMYAVDVRSS